MGVSWTTEQQQVINLRDRNILVSAAAGSGKTAVLVQRILSKVTDPKNPVDIDRLLIMTFTRAAAGEMRERIAGALENALYENPEDEHLQKQTTLIHTAQITTIDGFCAYVIRNYFHLIGLDPGYRTGDEGELKLLREEVMGDLLEDYYAKGEEKYKNFIECYASGKDDEEIKNFIYSVYEKAMSHPYPDEWLKKCTDCYKISDIEKIKESNWMILLWENTKKDLEQARLLAQQARELCCAPGGPYLYEDALAEDLLLIRELQEKAETKDYDGIAGLLCGGSPSFAKLSGKKPKEVVDDTMKEQVKAIRESEKDILKELGSRYFALSEEEIPQLLVSCREPVEMLVELTREFIRRFGEKKREKNILDFTDMEHFALQILMEKQEDGSYKMSQAAKELSLKYDEVMVDEYQDSNLVQEMITTCVSGWAQDRKNIFMVGDVKQSIYSFRLARPELFMEKYKKYSLTDSKEQRIDLHKNFRSRAQVLESANFIFRQIMGEDLGKIVYDKAAALYPGAVFPEGASEEFLSTDVLLVEKDGEELEDSMAGQDAKELEALAIAHKIQEMVGKEKILDKETKEYRPVRYGDIVILLRSAAGWTESFTEVLSAHGIPVYSASKTGYFSANEVVTVLNYLRVCDNPLQDIPLAGVLRSPMVGCTSEELAVLREEHPDGLLYECAQAFWERHRLTSENGTSNYEKDKSGLLNDAGHSAEQTKNEAEKIQKLQDSEWNWGLGSQSEKSDEDVSVELHTDAETLLPKENQVVLWRKLNDFLCLLEEMRDLAVYTPVHELILQILRKTGYGNYAKALPNGAQRDANLAMLIEKAMEYEKTSYRGLFNFVRYIEQLQKYEVDYGEVNLSGAGEGLVQIMTIHKSKGLEFPIVILAGMGKKFNFQDLNARLLIHADYGLGADAILPDRRLVVSTLNKQVIRSVLLEECLGEEIRVLYVALTRAKEKLILTGTIAGLKKRMLSLSGLRDNETELLPSGIRFGARTYWDYVLPALARHCCMDELYEEFGMVPPANNPFYHVPVNFQVKKITAAMLVENEVVEQATGQMEGELLRNWDPEKVFDEEIKEELEKRFGFVYPYEYRKDIPVKVSVSDLKKKSYEEEFEIPALVVEEEGKESGIPVQTGPEEESGIPVQTEPKEDFGILEERENIEKQPVEPKRNVTKMAWQEKTVDEKITGEGMYDLQEMEVEPYVPRFIREQKDAEESCTGAARGTAYHRVMECLIYSHTDSDQDLKDQLKALVESRKMSQAEADCVRIQDLKYFLASNLGKRMKAAFEAGTLFREQPFVISRSAAKIDPAWDAEERVLVQGIIDAYFLEKDAIILVDYKTDYVKKGEEQKLKDRYHTQLEDYAQALERMTGRAVKEKYIYSFALKKAILL